MTKKTKKEVQVNTPKPAENELQRKMSELNATLIKLGHLDSGNFLEDEALVDFVTMIVKQYNVLAKNSGIVIAHTMDVYKSMAERGAYPPELVKGSPQFKGKEGFAELKMVLDSILPLFAVQQAQENDTTTK